MYKICHGIVDIDQNAYLSLHTNCGAENRFSVNVTKDVYYYSFSPCTQRMWYKLLKDTKFGPDHCLGIIKRSYKVSKVSSLYELAQIVELSSTVGVNKSQLVGTHDGVSYCAGL